MTFDDLMKVKRGNSYNIQTQGLIYPYFILNLSKFGIFVTMYDHFMIFFFISYVLNFDDLA